jgi:hypothetical protein
MKSQTSLEHSFYHSRLILSPRFRNSKESASFAIIQIRDLCHALNCEGAAVKSEDRRTVNTFLYWTTCHLVDLDGRDRVEPVETNVMVLTYGTILYSRRKQLKDLVRQTGQFGFAHCHVP